MIINYLGKEGKSLPSFVKGASIVENENDHDHDHVPQSIHRRQHYSIHYNNISIPFLQLMNSDISSNYESSFQKYRQQQQQRIYHTNPNIIIVNIKMGKDWTWNASRKYGLCEIYSFLLSQLYANSKCTNDPLKNIYIKANWADRVICQFIRALLFVIQNNVNDNVNVNGNNPMISKL